MSKNERFSYIENDLIRNTMVQIFPLIFVSNILLMMTTSDIVFGFSAIALFTSLMTHLLLQPTYEMDYINYGKYYPIMKIYYKPIIVSTISLSCALFMQMYTFPGFGNMTKLSFCIVICLVYWMVNNFYESIKSRP
jgi:hypothetical protein